MKSKTTTFNMKRSIVFLLFGLFAVFQSEAHVQLNNPTGGETFNPGDTVTVTWQILITHSTKNWDLFFSSDGGVTWDTIQVDIDKAALSYDWIVPATATNQGKVKIEMDNNGTNYNDISKNFSISANLSVGEKPAIAKINAYPNPLKENAIIVFENAGRDEQTLTIYDTQGRLVQTIENITSNRVTIERDNMKSGLYVFQLRRGNKIIGVGKLNVE